MMRDKSMHGWSGAIKSLAVGLFVFYLGREMAVWLTARNVHGFLAFLDNVLAGIAAGLMVFIYERRRQHGVDKLRESEQRFRLVADAAPALIWMSGPDKLCTYFNKPWLDFTGRTAKKELGNGWAEGVHPEELQKCLDTYARSFDRREQFRMEYRLRRHDGEFRWMLDIGVPRFNQDESFAGYIVIVVDVTDRKEGEQRLH
jgi:PAS domain S-box-containing protein